jgi:hypothetical protein
LENGVVKSWLKTRSQYSSTPTLHPLIKASIGVTEEDYSLIFSQDVLSRLFPRDRADQFFEALLGNATEGAYDIQLAFRGHDPDKRKLFFELRLKERPGKCLACNVTYGLPQVFSRHPVINLKGLVREIETLLNGSAKCVDWTLHGTQSVSRDLHVVPLTLTLGR